MGRTAGIVHRYRPVAGCRHRNGDLRIIVSFDDDTFAEINEGAKANDCSFSSQVRMLIEVGLETLKIEDQRAAIEIEAQRATTTEIGVVRSTKARAEGIAQKVCP